MSENAKKERVGSRGTVVLTYGTFDLFHYGHLRILERSSQLGDFLVVGVSTDEFNRVKGKRCVYPYRHRARIVEAIRCVDLVIPERCWEQKREDIARHNVDVLAMGTDWEGEFDHLADACRVVYLPRTPDISSTGIKQDVKENH